MQEFVVNERVLAEIVQKAFNRSPSVLASWQREAISYRIINRVTAGLYRITGTSIDQRGSYDWSLVLKILQHTTADTASTFNPSEDPAHWNYWRREADAYLSDILHDLPHGLGVPRCYAVSAEAPATLWLWMEDIHGLPATQWPLQRFQLAAQHLGQFQAWYAAQPELPTFPWLSRKWLRSWVPTETAIALNLISDPTQWQHPLLAPGLSATHADRIISIWQQRFTFLATVEQLPQTVCHLDVWPPNLFARQTPDGQDQTVFLDWSQIGLGAYGEDIANLVLDSVWMLKIDSAMLTEFERLVWDGYLTGLRLSGWDGDARSVRFVYAATAALRFGLLAGLLLQQVHDTQEHKAIEQHYQRPFDQIMAQRTALVAHALQLADEAETLLPLVTAA
ncbi:MAG: hypothetical protein ABI901_13015 [Roseiflexaceae bacterium]